MLHNQKLTEKMEIHDPITMKILTLEHKVMTKKPINSPVKMKF